MRTAQSEQLKCLFLSILWGDMNQRLSSRRSACGLSKVSTIGIFMSRNVFFCFCASNSMGQTEYQIGVSNYSIIEVLLAFGTVAHPRLTEYRLWFYFPGLLITWAYFRLYVFPTEVIYSAIYALEVEGVWAMVTMALALLSLHSYWCVTSVDTAEALDSRSR